MFLSGWEIILAGSQQRFYRRICPFGEQLYLTSCHISHNNWHTLPIWVKLKNSKFLILRYFAHSSHLIVYNFDNFIFFSKVFLSLQLCKVYQSYLIGRAWVIVCILPFMLNTDFMAQGDHFEGVLKFWLMPFFLEVWVSKIHRLYEFLALVTLWNTFSLWSH